ncbi:MAG: hypothetical protein AAGU75_21450, partial [Bacillota bacterium]
QCVTATKKGKKHCPASKAIPEKLLEDAFVKSYGLLCDNNTDVLDELVQRMESVLRSNDFKNRLVKVENEIDATEQKRNKLVDMHLDGIIDKATYEKKYEELEINLSSLSSEREQLKQSTQEEINFEKRIAHIRKVLEHNKVLTAFDRCVFESIVEKVIIGELDESGNVNPYKLTFVYKTGFINTVQNKMGKQMGNRRRENDIVNVPSYSAADTRGGCNRKATQKYIDIISPRQFFKYVTFTTDDQDSRSKNLMNRRFGDFASKEKLLPRSLLRVYSG